MQAVVSPRILRTRIILQSWIPLNVVLHGKKNFLKLKNLPVGNILTFGTILIAMMLRPTYITALARARAQHRTLLITVNLETTIPCWGGRYHSTFNNLR